MRLQERIIKVDFKILCKRTILYFDFHFFYIIFAYVNFFSYVCKKFSYTNNAVYKKFVEIRRRKITAGNILKFRVSVKM